MILGTDESASMRVNPMHPGRLFWCGWLDEDGDDEYLGMSISEAAAKLGVDDGALSRVVEGRAPFTIDLALKMEALGWSTADSRLKHQLDYDLAQARKERNQPLAQAPAVLRRKRMPAEAEAEETEQQAAA